MSPRRVDPELTARRREALIKAGYAEILEKGLHSTTIDSVVARANSSKGGALHYFHSKEDLFYAVLEWLLNELTRSLDQVAASQESPRERLAAELELLFHSTEVNRKLYLVLFDFVTLGSRSDRFRQLFHDFLSALPQARRADYLRWHQAGGVSPRPPGGRRRHHSRAG